MSKEAVIKLSRCTLVLPETELIGCLALKPDVFEKAVKRGKGLLRSESSQNRQLRMNAKGFGRWQLFEILKGSRSIDDQIIQFVEGMDSTELREGLLEFMILKSRPGVNHRL